MEEEHEIFKSLENQNLILIRYKNYFYNRYELTIEINDNERPKYPLLFKVSKRCEEAEVDETIIRFMAIAEAEFPGNTWQLL